MLFSSVIAEDSIKDLTISDKEIWVDFPDKTDLAITDSKDKIMATIAGMFYLSIVTIDDKLAFSSQNSYVDGYQRNNNNDRFPPRNRSSSFNDFSRQDGRRQQQNQPFERLNRNNDDFPSARRSGSATPSSQRSSGSPRAAEDDVTATQSPRRTRSTNEENPTQEQSPWERANRQ